MNLAAFYVYSVIVGWIFITGVGLLPFIPEEVAVASLGAWVHKNPEAMLVLSWLFCLAAVLGTDLFLYMIGRLGGPRLMSKPWVQKLLKPERVQIFADNFQHRGVWFMLSARLIPGWRTAVFITAGVIRYPTERFMLADAISSIPLVTFFFFGGYYAADWIDAIIANLHQAQYVILLLALLGVLLLIIALYFRWMRKKEREEAAAEEKQHKKMEDAGQLPVTPENAEEVLTTTAEAKEGKGKDGGEASPPEDGKHLATAGQLSLSVLQTADQAR